MIVHFGADHMKAVSLVRCLMYRFGRERKAFISPHMEDRPLIVQLCTNDADEFLKAAILVRQMASHLMNDRRLQSWYAKWHPSSKKIRGNLCRL